MSDTPDTPTAAGETGCLDSERTNAINNKRTGDQAFGGDDAIGAKIGRSLTLQPTPQAGDGEEQVTTASPTAPPMTVLTVTVSQSKSSGNVSGTSDPAELSVVKSDEIDEGFRALADLIDVSSRKCSYNQGYVKRQLVYACRTCTLDVLEPAGFCMACALHCHEQHDVVPMLTRRSFRCDCGNSKFGPRKCQLTAAKESANTENIYNQNFHGKVCSCMKTLAASGVSDTEVDEDIVQCRLCEEQFHASHLGVTEEDFGDDWNGELICQNCLNEHPFLQLYQADLNHPETFAPQPDVEGACLLAGLRKKFSPPEKASKGFVFPAGWWEHLCQCEGCSDMYQRNKIDFLLDPEDTFTAYEEREVNKNEENVQRASDMSPEEIFAQICDGFDSVTQVELAHWFNNLREVFVEFLQTRIQQGQAITDADIGEFFKTFNNPDDEDEEDFIDDDAL